MSLLFETLCVREGQILNLSFHQQRVDRAYAQFFASSHPPLHLARVLQTIVLPTHGLYKCRVVYEIQQHRVEIEPYQPRRIQTLRLVDDDTIRYDHKCFDRSHLQTLFQQRNGCDEILIVQRGRITDTSHANIVLYNGSTWVTPDTPLLRGTQREFLLQQQRIHLASVRVQSLHQEYTHIGMINAMNSWETMSILPIDAVIMPNQPSPQP